MYQECNCSVHVHYQIGNLGAAYGSRDGTNKAVCVYVPVKYLFVYEISNVLMARSCKGIQEKLSLLAFKPCRVVINARHKTSHLALL